MYEQLILSNEKKIVELLLSLGQIALYKPKGPISFNNMIPVYLKRREQVIDKMVTKYRDLWPSGHTGDKLNVKIQMVKLLDEGYKYKDIMEVTKYHLESSGDDYIGYADYFLYKQVTRGTWRSRFKTLYEKMNNEEDEQYDY